MLSIGKRYAQAVLLKASSKASKYFFMFRLPV